MSNTGPLAVAGEVAEDWEKADATEGARWTDESAVAVLVVALLRDTSTMEKVDEVALFGVKWVKP